MNKTEEHSSMPVLSIEVGGLNSAVAAVMEKRKEKYNYEVTPDEKPHKYNLKLVTYAGKFTVEHGSAVRVLQGIRTRKERYKADARRQEESCKTGGNMVSMW